MRQEAAASFERGQMWGQAIELVLAAGVKAVWELLLGCVRELCAQRFRRRALNAPADGHEAARQQLENLARSLAKAHPGAAASLREGLEETLTVKRLGLTGPLERSPATTNPIENTNGTIRRVARRVKHRRSGERALRWVAAALLETRRGFHRLKGCREMKMPMSALRALDRTPDVTRLRKAGQGALRGRPGNFNYRRDNASHPAV